MLNNSVDRTTTNAELRNSCTLKVLGLLCRSSITMPVVMQFHPVGHLGMAGWVWVVYKYISFLLAFQQLGLASSLELSSKQSKTQYTPPITISSCIPLYERA